MEKILNELSKMKSKLRELQIKKEAHVFDVTMTERKNLLEMIENKINKIKDTNYWRNEEVLAKRVENRYAIAKNNIAYEDDWIFFHSIVRLTNEVKNLDNRIKNRDKILFATGVMKLTEQFKNQIHYLDFLDNEVLYLPVIPEIIEKQNPAIILISELLETENDELLNDVFHICLKNNRIKFVLMGDRFLHSKEFNKLNNVSFIASKEKDFVEVIRKNFEI